MTNKTELAITALQKKNLETAARLAKLSIEHAQRIGQLRRRTAQEIFEENAVGAKAWMQVKKPQDAWQLQSQCAQQTTEKMLECTQQIAEAAAQMQAELGNAVRQHMEDSRQHMMDAMDEWLKGMPLNSHIAAEALNHSLDAARKTLEHATKTSSDAFSAIVQATAKANSARRTGSTVASA